MLARVYSCEVIGLDGVVVEVDYPAGIPGMTIVGMPDSAMQERREWVQAAVRNAEIPFSTKRLEINLASAGGRKVHLYQPGAALTDLHGQLPTSDCHEPTSVGIHTIGHYFRA